MCVCVCVCVCVCICDANTCTQHKDRFTHIHNLFQDTRSAKSLSL